MNEPTIYRDGYTRRVFIKGVPRIHGDVEVEMRPMVPEERDELNVIVQRDKPARYNAVIRAALATHVVSWNATDDKGQAVEPSAANMGRVPPVLYDRLFCIMTGRDGGDPPPEPSEDEADDYATRMLKGEDQDAKN